MASFSYSRADSSPLNAARTLLDPGATVSERVGGSSATASCDPGTRVIAAPRPNLESTAGRPEGAFGNADLSEVVTNFLRSSTAPDIAPTLTGLPVSLWVSATRKANATARVTIDKATHIIAEARAHDRPNSPAPMATMC